MRAALFQAGLSESFQMLMRDILKEGKELLKPHWSEVDHSIWIEGPAKQNGIRKGKERPLLI